MDRESNKVIRNTYTEKGKQFIQKERHGGSGGEHGNCSRQREMEEKIHCGDHEQGEGLQI